MYFPYLYGRRSELLALRDAASEFDLSATVAPVIEPVNEDTGSIKRCLQHLGSHGLYTTVIVNPRQGDFRTANTNRLRRALASDFSQRPSLLPGLLCDQHTLRADVIAFLEAYPRREVTLLYCGPQLGVSDIRSFAEEQRVRFHISLRGQMPTSLRAVLPRGKAVDIRDGFNALARNADYAGTEYFSDSHESFRADAVGYGDYSVIGAVYHAGGGPAHAVAIHITFVHSS